MRNEIWKKWPLNPNYEVSVSGLVRNAITQRELTQMANGDSGLRVYIEGKRYYVHRMMIDTFYDLHKPPRRIRHKNGNNFDNRLSNLEIADTESVGYHHASRRYRDQVVKCSECIRRYDCDLYSRHDGDWFCADGTTIPDYKSIIAKRKMR